MLIDEPPLELTVVPVLEAENPASSVFEWTGSISDETARQVSLFSPNGR